MKYELIFISLGFFAASCTNHEVHTPLDMGALTADLSTPPQKTESGTVYSSRTGDNNTVVPVGNAQVCILDQSKCAWTDSNGSYIIEAPSVGTTETDLAVNVTADGYLGLTQLIRENVKEQGSVVSVWSTTSLLDPNSFAKDWANLAHFTYPANGKAFVSVRIIYQTGNALAGATVSLSPKPSEGIVYINSMTGIPDPSLTATTPESREGSVYIGGVTPGKFELTVTAPGLSCGPEIADGWPSSKANTVAGLAVPDSKTEIQVICK